jgi:5-methylcytosine-specific restriction endonuclease McrA
MDQILFKKLMAEKSDVVVDDLKNLVKDERALCARVLCYLAVVQKRRLFINYGFTDLFTFCRGYLGYTEAEAQNRKSAVFLLNEIPEIKPKIEDGSLSLTAITMAQTLFRRERQLAKPFTKEQKIEILKGLENKSTRDCKREIIKHSSEPVILKERIRILSETHVEIVLPLKKEMLEKVDELKDYFSNAHPNMTNTELFEMLVDRAIEEKRKAQARSRRTVSGAHEKISDSDRACCQKVKLNSIGIKEKPSSYIKAQVKREVFQKCANQCSHIDPVTNVRCQNKRFLEIDHIIPKALGGTSDLDNLRLLCRAHNQHHAIRYFGFKHMDGFINSIE